MEHANQAISNHIGVSISNDKLSAELRLTSSEKVGPMPETQLYDLLRKHGIIFGVLAEEVTKFAADPDAYANRPLLIAQGEPPVPGTDGSIRYLFREKENNQKPQVLDDGRVDFRDVLRINNVKKGQVIAERIPAEPGAPGKTVTGEEIPAPKVKEAYFKPGKNVVLDEERTRLYAVTDGMVTFTDNEKVNVFPVYEVNGDVDYRSGNIDFVGNVVVRGNVISGFRVKAEGDVRITGSVEGAEIIAAGSIDIAEGIVAHNKGFVKAGKTIKCSFIQDANVEAAEDLIVNQSIMHSHVRAGRAVICNGAKGLIVGGVVQAGESVTARTVGNMTHTPTTIEVGVLPEMRNELNQLHKDIRVSADNLDKTEKALRILEQMAQVTTLPTDKQQMMTKLQLTKRQLNEQLVQMQERVEELEQVLENIEAAKVEVSGTVYGGSKIVIGRYTRFIKDAAQHVVFRYEDGEVVMNAKL